MDLLFIDLKLDSNFTSLVADEVSVAFGSLQKIDKICVSDGESANLELDKAKQLGYVGSFAAVVLAFTNKITTDANCITIPTRSGYTFTGYALQNGTIVFESDGCLEEMSYLLVFDVADELGDDQDDDDECQIIGDLQVIGAYLEGYGEGRQEPAPKVFAFISQQHASDDGCHVSHSHGFGVVARPDDDE